MNKKRFKLNKLQIIDPGLIISDTQQDDVSDVILILAIIFNHLKGNMMAHKLFLEEYERPEKMEISDHSGEYGGMDIQYKSLQISCVQEFFVFVRKNKDIIESKRFKKYTAKLPKKTLRDWSDLVNIALENKASKSKFISFLELIRNNIGFHFNYELKEIRSGYIKHFYGDPKNKANTNAFFSIGKDLPSTRFYFGDAAILGYIESKAPENFVNEFFDNMDKIKETLYSMIIIFLNEKGYSEYKK